MTSVLFVVLAVAILLSTVALYVFICLYVYNDAKVNSEKPVLWLLITIFTPDLFGFLIYLLVGRKKDRVPVRKYKLPAIISGIALAVTMTAFIATISFSGDIPVMEGVSVGMINNNIGSKWEVSFRSSGETLERTIALTDEELENLTIEASCEEGEIYLLLLQGKNAQVIDLTDYPRNTPELTDFTAGNIKLSLYNEKAKNAKVKIDW